MSSAPWLRNTATRSPLAMPRAASALASRELAARSWPNVQWRTEPVGILDDHRQRVGAGWRSQTARPMLKRSGTGQRNWRIASS